jgi:hypothetical protein
MGQHSAVCVIGHFVLANVTGVAYGTPRGRGLPLDEITPVTDWGPQMGNHDKIPSVYSYSTPSENLEQQWGLSLSNGAVSMVNTKLELDVNDVRTELDIILQTLNGMQNLNFEYIKEARGFPAYPWQTPRQIVTDYLTEVFANLLKAVSRFTKEFRAQTPVDIVVTVPVVCLMCLPVLALQ